MIWEIGGIILIALWFSYKYYSIIKMKQYIQQVNEFVQSDAFKNILGNLTAIQNESEDKKEKSDNRSDRDYIYGYM